MDYVNRHYTAALFEGTLVGKTCTMHTALLGAQLVQENTAMPQFYGLNVTSTEPFTGGTFDLVLSG